MILSSAHTATLKSMSLLMESSDVGTNVALQCLCQDNAAVMFYWYKQILGKKPKLVCSFYKHNNIGNFQNEFNNSRFSLDTENHGNILLKISDLRISDSATYHCVKGNLAEFKFCEGTTLIVKDFGLNLKTSRHQSETEPILSRGFVTPSCAVQTGYYGGGHGLYWFTNYKKYHPGLIYSQVGREPSERKPNTSRNSCAFSLSMENMNKSHAGTYLCAVASCGHLLFGNRTIVPAEGEAVSSVLVYLLSGTFAFSTLLVVSLASLVYRLSKRQIQQTECSDTFSATTQVRIISCRDIRIFLVMC
uniref:Uncharacterized LOC105923636 n=1 Tax=Fundulus heteroclitus TaxID=8078 RepID=A0A3Q2UAT3_FUNHE